MRVRCYRCGNFATTAYLCQNCGDKNSMMHAHGDCKLPDKDHRWPWFGGVKSVQHFDGTPCPLELHTHPHDGKGHEHDE